MLCSSLSVFVSWVVPLQVCVGGIMGVDCGIVGVGVGVGVMGMGGCGWLCYCVFCFCCLLCCS